MTINLNSFLLISILLLSITQSHADKLNIAVASNFTHTLRALAKDFESKTGHQVRISSASTGKLFTQINHGAPFDVFLAGDEHRPNLLITKGKATAEYSHNYAIGKLVFISHINSTKSCQGALSSPALKRLAIANHKTAPYGMAAKQTLGKLKLWHTIKPKLVMGENIAQALQFVATANAQAGFVAKAMLLQDGKINTACEWPVPAQLHEPIKQKMLVLAKSLNKSAARAFWHYMQSDDAKTIIKNSGYDVP